MVAALPADPPKKRSNLTLRIVVSLIFLPCAILIARRGELHFVGLVDLVIFTGMLEFYKLIEGRGFAPGRVIGTASAILLSWYMYFRGGAYANFLFAVAILTMMTFELSRRSTEQAVLRISTTIFGVIYVGWLGSHLILLRELPRISGLDYAMGAEFVCLAAALTWANDTGAFFVGRTFGRRPLFPSVSPKKSVEGAIGGVATAMLAGYVCQMTFADYLSVPMALALGATAAVAGSTGDLVESLMKRDSKVKDSGDFIPGHGGALDRFDSLLFSAPLIYYFLKFFVV